MVNSNKCVIAGEEILNDLCLQPRGSDLGLVWEWSCTFRPPWGLSPRPNMFSTAADKGDRSREREIEETERTEASEEEARNKKGHRLS